MPSKALMKSKMRRKPRFSHTKPTKTQLLKDNVGIGIHIGDLTSHNANHDIEKSSKPAIDRNFGSSNDAPALLRRDLHGRVVPEQQVKQSVSLMRPTMSGMRMTSMTKMRR